MVAVKTDRKFALRFASTAQYEWDGPDPIIHISGFAVDVESSRRETRWGDAVPGR